MNSLANSRLVKRLFFGNYFYGLCAVALSIEASLQQRFPLNGLLFYLLIFCATVLYYSKAYVNTETSGDAANLRSAWYASNKGQIRRSQLFILVVFVVCGVIFFTASWRNIIVMTFFEWLMVFIFPFVAILYYGDPGTFLHTYNLRRIGWLKPFIIGFTWAGMVTVYPVLYYCIGNGMRYEPSLVSVFLFVKNFMFVTILCIMFDIKDYEMDYNQQLKTFVVKFGLKKTVFFIIMPLCIAGLASFIGYALIHRFHMMKIVLNTIPFLLTFGVTYFLHYRRSIFYYLIIIDGLMLVKAICGITAMHYF